MPARLNLGLGEAVGPVPRPALLHIGAGQALRRIDLVLAGDVVAC
jgi:hypothetical protein